MISNRTKISIFIKCKIYNQIELKKNKKPCKNKGDFFYV